MIPAVPSTTDATATAIIEAVARHEAARLDYFEMEHGNHEPPIVYRAVRPNIAETTAENVAEATETVVTEVIEVPTVAEAMVIDGTTVPTVAGAAEGKVAETTDEVADAIEEGEIVDDATENPQPPTITPSDPQSQSNIDDFIVIDTVGQDLTAEAVNQPNAGDVIMRDVLGSDGRIHQEPYVPPTTIHYLPPDDSGGWEYMMGVYLDPDECAPGMRWRARYGRDQHGSKWRREVPEEEDTDVADYDDYFNEPSEEDSDEGAQRKKKAAKRRQQRKNKAARKRHR
jgi:hypothetical protein